MEEDSPWWFGLALGVALDKENGSVLGGGSGSKGKSKGSGQGFLNLGGYQVYGYVGPIVGYGRTVGGYGTAGLLIGQECDFAFGGGIAFGKKVGLGILVPLRKANEAAQALMHSDKVLAGIEHGRMLVSGLVDKLDYNTASVAIMSGAETAARLINGAGQMYNEASLGIYQAACTLFSPQMTQVVAHNIQQAAVTLDKLV